MADLPKYGSVTKCPKCGNGSEGTIHTGACVGGLPVMYQLEWAESKWIEGDVTFGIPIIGETYSSTDLRRMADKQDERVGTYIKRTCKRCTYSWDEAPLDAEEKE